MKRINIYIPENTDRDIDKLSELLQINRSEVMRNALSEFSHKHSSDLNEFMDGLDELNSTQLDKSNDAFITKCKNDSEFFIRNCITIHNPVHGRIPFNLYEYQTQLLFKLNTYNKIVINASRQLGVTSIQCAHILHYVLFNPNKNAMILTPKQFNAVEYMRNIRDMIETLPECIKSSIIKSHTKTRIEFTNGSKIIGNNISVAACRGISIGYLFIDEFSFSTRQIADEFTDSILPLIATDKNVKIVISSTPTTANHFYQLWTSAIANYNSYHAIKLPYTLHPHRGYAWASQMENDIGKTRFDQEFKCEFNLVGKGDLYDT